MGNRRKNERKNEKKRNNRIKNSGKKMKGLVKDMTKFIGGEDSDKVLKELCEKHDLELDADGMVSGEINEETLSGLGSMISELGNICLKEAPLDEARKERAKEILTKTGEIRKELESIDYKRYGIKDIGDKGRQAHEEIMEKTAKVRESELKSDIVDVRLMFPTESTTPDSLRTTYPDVDEKIVNDAVELLSDIRVRSRFNRQLFNRYSTYDKIVLTKEDLFFMETWFEMVLKEQPDIMDNFNHLPFLNKFVMTTPHIVTDGRQVGMEGWIFEQLGEKDYRVRLVNNGLDGEINAHSWLHFRAFNIMSIENELPLAITPSNRIKLSSWKNAEAVDTLEKMNITAEAINNLGLDAAYVPVSHRKKINLFSEEHKNLGMYSLELIDSPNKYLDDRRRAFDDDEVKQFCCDYFQRFLAINFFLLNFREDAIISKYDVTRDNPQRKGRMKTRPPKGNIVISRKCYRFEFDEEMLEVCKNLEPAEREYTKPYGQRCAHWKFLRVKTDYFERNPEKLTNPSYRYPSAQVLAEKQRYLRPLGEDEMFVEYQTTSTQWTRDPEKLNRSVDFSEKKTVYQMLSNATKKIMDMIKNKAAL